MLIRALEKVGAVLPRRRRVATERRVRGWVEARRLRKADAAVVSFGKSGRTWLRVMLSHYYASTAPPAAGIDPESLLRFDNFRRRVASIPAILFTHDNYLGDWTHNAQSKSDYVHVPVVLLVRDPADVAVSQFFQWQHRMRPHKKLINGYPDDPDLSMFDFVMGEWGVPKVVTFMNAWADALPTLSAGMIVRYEDLRSDPAQWLAAVLAHLGAGSAVDAGAIAAAVEYAAFDNMRQREAAGAHGSARLQAGDPSNPDSFKTRRAKVGGYRDDFSPEQVARLDQYIAERTAPVFGYGDRHLAAPAG